MTSKLVRILVLVSALIVLAGPACRRGPALVPEVVSITAKKVPLDPGDPLWDDAPEHVAKLILQDLVEPRLLETSTSEVRVRAVSDGQEIALRLQWSDASKDDLPGPSRFIDGCAVQVPTKIEPSVPAPQMGEPGKPVEIAFWRADWQASVDGRLDSIKSLYPNASVDHYPYEAAPLEKGSPAQKEMATRYSPATAVGNRRVGPREAPVEDLLAEGPGTLAPAQKPTSRGRGIRLEAGWSVVIIRRVPEGLTPGARSQVAFAIWEGSRKETGARKMRTGWIPLLMKGEQ